LADKIVRHWKFENFADGFIGGAEFQGLALLAHLVGHVEERFKALGIDEGDGGHVDDDAAHGGAERMNRAGFKLIGIGIQ